LKIESIAVHPLSATTAVPLSTAHETFRTSHFILVEVKTDDGLTGYGKVHGEPMKTICEWILKFGEIVKGMDALGHVEVWEKLFLLTCPRPGGLQGSGGLPPPLPRSARPQIMAAIAGIDIALWDIKGKAAGLPVYKLLGGARQSYFTYATGSYYRDNATIETYANEMASFVEKGYRAVKAKCCWAEMSEEVERIAAIREAIGKDTLFMLDMNAPYDVEECIRFAHAVAPYDIFWLEEPLHWYLQPADYVKLAAASPIYALCRLHRRPARRPFCGTVRRAHRAPPVARSARAFVRGFSIGQLRRRNHRQQGARCARARHIQERPASEGRRSSYHGRAGLRHGNRLGLRQPVPREVAV